MNTKQTLWASALTAVGASLCCVAPLALVTLGIGGAWIGTLVQLEPLRPLLVVITLALLGFAWYRLYRQPANCAPGDACLDPSVQKRQRIIFWLAFSLLIPLLAFPWYVPLFY